jgi:hypothetical protein
VLRSVRLEAARREVRIEDSKLRGGGLNG